MKMNGFPFITKKTRVKYIVKQKIPLTRLKRNWFVSLSKKVKNAYKDKAFISLIAPQSRLIRTPININGFSYISTSKMKEKGQ